jgi:hypothetical protein
MTHPPIFSPQCPDLPSLDQLFTLFLDFHAIQTLSHTTLSDPFFFLINGSSHPTTLESAIAFSPAVSHQLSVDSTARTFTIFDNRIDPASLQFLTNFTSPSLNKSFFFLCQQLFKPDLELFVGLPLSQTLSVDSFDSFLSNDHFQLESEDSLLRFLLSFDPFYYPLLRHVQVSYLSPESYSLLERLSSPDLPESLWLGIVESVNLVSAGLLDSLIISELPPLLSDLKNKHFKLLWRGSRDGFRAIDFHRCCDGHPNTLTFILDTDENIFGGFTPLTWESRIWKGKDRLLDSRTNCIKSDKTLKSYIFTLKNPHGFEPEKFGLLKHALRYAIYCDAEWGPTFGGGFCVMDECNQNQESFTKFFGNGYHNPGDRCGTFGENTFFTGNPHFTVKEIEIFEILDYGSRKS